MVTDIRMLPRAGDKLTAQLSQRLTVFPLADLSVSRLHLKLIPILVGAFCLAGWAEQPAAPEGAAVA